MHTWVYEYNDSSNNGRDTRTCKDCHLKQFAMFKDRVSWHNVPPTKEDIRDTKIDDLLK
jgi:hypothetical protein